MDWNQALEARKPQVIFALCLISAATLVVTSMRDFAGYDVFWQLQMGRDWIENGLSPFVDHYSFTYPGAEIVGPPVLFQALIHGLVDFLGEYSGFFTFRVAAFLLALGMMLLWLRQIGAPVLAYCLVIPLLTCLLQLRGIVRPELLSYALAILAMVLYRRARTELSLRAMWPVVLLMLLWTNYHSSILAYVIFFGLFVDIADRLVRQKASSGEWAKWLAWGLVMVGVGFIKPNFNHLVLQLLQFPREWKELIQEYNAPLGYLTLPAIYVLAGIVPLTVWMLIRQRKFGYLVVTAVFVYAGVTMARMVTPGGIVILCIFAHALTDIDLPKFSRTAHPIKSKSVAILALLAFLVPMLNGVQQAQAYLAENRKPFSRLPLELTAHLRGYTDGGQVFNSYAVGGYLIYRLPRTFQIYMDGRTGILYPVELYKRQEQALADPASFLAEVDRYGIDFAVVLASEPVASLMAEAGFELDFVDAQYALYRRSEGAFVNAGRLWARPYCWSADSWTALEPEFAGAMLTFPPAAPVLGLLHTAMGYATTENPEEYLDHVDASGDLTDAQRRFLAYRMIDANRFEAALAHLQRVRVREPKDYLAAALTHLRMDKPDVAEQVLDEATRIQWVRLAVNDQVLLNALLEEIARRRPLELLEAEYVASLASRVRALESPPPGQPLRVGDFCGEYSPNRQIGQPVQSRGEADTVLR